MKWKVKYECMNCLETFYSERIIERSDIEAVKSFITKCIQGHPTEEFPMSIVHRCAGKPCARTADEYIASENDIGHAILTGIEPIPEDMPTDEEAM